MLREPRASKTAVSSSQSGKTKKRGGPTDEHIHGEIYAAIINHQIRPATPLQEDALTERGQLFRQSAGPNEDRAYLAAKTWQPQVLAPISA